MIPVFRQQFCYMDQALPTSLTTEVLSYVLVSFQNGNVKMTLYSEMMFKNNQKGQVKSTVCKYSAGRLLTLTAIVQLCVENYYEIKGLSL